MKNILRNQKGITIMTLVMTIIVLLILSGITIKTLTGDNGILTKAGEAKKDTDEVTIKEDIETAVLASFSKGNINIDLLNNNLKDIKNLKYNDNSISETNVINKLPILVQVKDYEFMILEDGNVREPYQEYTLGDEVTVGGEQFFVIEEQDSKIKNEITLISKYNLSKTEESDGTYKQQNLSNKETACSFATTPYWSNIEGITYRYDLNNVENSAATAVNRAKYYGASKGGKGRLLTYEEAVDLKGKISNIILGKNYENEPVENDNYLYYWLGTAYDDLKACILYGGNSLIYNYNVGNSNNGRSSSSNRNF